METIAAVVVTFNRLSLLKQCLNSLSIQTRKIDHIIVINNGSTDGTVEYLNDQKHLQVIHQENVGGAGGFYVGMKTAFELNYDWIWIMDDDAFPHEECLANLFHEKTPEEKTNVVLAPLVVEGRKIDHLHRGHIDLQKIRYPLQKSTSNEIFNTEANPISFISFIGMLIGRNVVEKVGLPLYNYFIFHDDVEYSIRITKGGFPMRLVKEAIIFHKIKGTPSAIELTNEGQVQSSKRQNVIDIIRDKRNKYRDKSAINLLSFIGMRNWIWTVVQHKGLNWGLMKLVLTDLFRGLLYILLSKANNLLLLRIYFNVYRQGFSGKFDNTAILSIKSR